MAKKDTERRIRSTIRTLRATGSPELIQVAQHYRKGLKFFLLSFKVLEAAIGVKLPAGIKISNIEFESSSKKGDEILLASKWIIKVVRERLQVSSEGV